MSTLDQFFGGGIKSHQTGYVSTTSLSSGSGEDTEYVDITISSVNTAKSLIFFDGGFADTVGNTTFTSGGTGTQNPTKRLTSSTNLRLAVPNTFAIACAGRWTIVEYR